MASRINTLNRADLWPILRRNAPILIVYSLIVVLLLIGGFSSDRFFTERNISNLLRQSAFLGTVALGQTLVILTGGIDLSVGSVVKLSVLVSAWVINGDPANTTITVLIILGLGVVIGTLHALIITRLNVAPFIVTLGTFSILQGLALTVSTKPIGQFMPELMNLYDLKIGPIFALIVFFIVLLIALVFMLRRTPFGRYIYAVGGNEEVARLSGIPIMRVKFGVYILCSTLAAFAGLLWLVRASGVGDPVTGEGLELRTITAVILGGTSLFGGRGGALGTLGGVLLLGLTANLLVVLNVNQWIQELIQGRIIVAAVALYRQRGRQ